MRALCNPPVASEHAGFSGRCSEVLPQYSRRIQMEHHRPSRCRFRVTRATERGIFDKAALGDSPLPPWLFGFQCNERYLNWDASAQIQLLKIHAAREMDKDMQWVEQQLNVLGALLPDLIAKLPQMKASLFLALVKDTQGIAGKMLRLKDLLPRVNVSQLVAGCPALLLSYDVPLLEANLGKLREAVSGRADAEQLIEREPMLLAADVAVLLQEAERLLPAEKDPVDFLAANPGTLLDMQQAGLPSTIDGNLWTAHDVNFL